MQTGCQSDKPFPSVPGKFMTMRGTSPASNSYWFPMPGIESLLLPERVVGARGQGRCPVGMHQHENTHLQLATCQIASTSQISGKRILDEIQLCTAYTQIPLPFIPMACG